MLPTLVVPSVHRIRGVSLSVVTLAAAFACGEKFTGVTPPSGGGSGSSSVADAGEGGAGASPAEGGRGGKGSERGGSGAGKGGATVVAGSGGTAGRAPSGDSGAAGEVAAGGEPSPPAPVPTDALELWFRTDEGVTALSSGTTTGWKDISGNGRDAGQTALNYGPKLVPDALAGKPALVFDGVDDFLALPPLDIDFSAGLSLFIVMQQESTGNCDPYFEASTDMEKNDIHFGDWMDSFNYEVEEDVAQDSRYPVLLHEPQIAVVIQTEDGWAHLRRNRNGAGDIKIRVPGPVERTEVFIGKSLYQSCSRFDGSIGELLLYSRGLEDSELLEVEQYLQRKWGCCNGEP